MACTLSNKCAKNLSKPTVLLQLIIKNVVTCFFGTQCSNKLSNTLEVCLRTHKYHGNHSPENVKFPDSLRHSSAAFDMLSVTHIMPVLVLLSVVEVRSA